MFYSRKSDTSVIWLVFLIIPYMPTYLSLTNESVYSITLYFRVLSFGVTLFLFITMFNHADFIKRKILVMLCLSLAYLSVLLISTYISDGDFLRFFGYFISCIGPLLIIGVYSRVRFEKLIDAFLWVFRMASFINLLLLVLYPDGVYVTTTEYSPVETRYNFLGLDNQTSPYFLTFIALTLYRNYLSNGFSKLSKIDIAIAVVNIVALWSATAIVGLFVLFLSYFIYSKGSKPISLNKAYLLIIIFFTSVVIFQATQYLSLITVSMLNKDVTFTGRIYIWQEALRMISEQRFFGMGILQTPNVVFFDEYGDFRTAHDEYLQIILQGGAGCIMVFGIQLNLVRSSLLKTTQKNNGQVALVCGFLAMLIMMLTESYGQMFCFYLLMYLTYLSSFNPSSKN